MKTQEEIEKLAEQYWDKQPYNEAKQCALIAVDEILLGYMSNPKISFWQSVYEEIETL